MSLDNEISEITLVRQVWQGWWELVNIDTGKVLHRSWKEDEIRGVMNDIRRNRFG